jgi:nicotinate-nucleotide adenylyltransferase
MTGTHTPPKGVPKKPGSGSQRIGIYAGTFDPVHAGHISFAVQALQYAKLDRIYFLPERRPRNKQGVEHFGHRVAMLKRALRPHATFAVLELDDVNFSIERTLPKLRRQFSGHQLVFLQGSDDAKRLAEWPHFERLLQDGEIVVGVRVPDSVEDIKELISGWPVQPKAATVFDSYAAHVSSGMVREGLRNRQTPHGLLQSVAHYSNHHWLYVSLS